MHEESTGVTMMRVSITPYSSMIPANFRADDILGSYILDSRASGEFNEEKAKDKLINLELSVDDDPKIVFTTASEDRTGGIALEEMGGMGRQGKLLRLAGWIDLDSKVTVSKHYLHIETLH